jgi:hypothetical protein
MRRVLLSVAGTAMAVGVLAGPAAGMASAQSTHQDRNAAPTIFIPKTVSAMDCVIGGGQPNYFFNICVGGLYNGWPLDPWTPQWPSLSASLTL